MRVSISNVEDFDPAEWKIEREGREWKGDEFDKRIYQDQRRWSMLAESLSTNARDSLF
ncbi:MAG: hypothetical protein ABR568_05970 [Pyrinomonadaceae bacterium]